MQLFIAGIPSKNIERSIHIDGFSVSAFLSGWYFDYSLKVKSLDITSDLIKAVLYSKVS